MRAEIKGKNRDWITKIILHEENLPVPYNFSFSPPAREKIEKFFGTTAIEETLDFPVRMNAPKSVKPLYADPSTYGSTAKDEFGVVWTTSELDRGSPVGPALLEPSLSSYRFPDPSAAYRFEELGDWCARNKEHFTVVWVGDLWERATFMRGMENLLEDLCLNPGFVEKLLSGLTDFVLRTMEILFDRFEFDAIALSDDYGTQHSLLMSPSDWRKFVKPRLSEIYALAKKHGRKVFHHSCGNVSSIVGDMIDLGLDILHPVQPEAMDIFKLKREFGADLTFCGGLGTQELLPRGTAEEVRAEIRRLKERMGRGGGYILEPGITLQADVPLENLAAMIEEARRG
ncbi:MAG TPA: uroporphyrinogen decarboxylase family protein [archaeon]|nr:uroporphyrinogen decarboxylase family protein [archaeon]